VKAHFYRELFCDWFDYEDVYRDVAGRVPEGGTIVELGVHEGASLAFLAVELVNLGKRVSLVGVDHFQTDDQKLARVNDWIAREGFANMIELVRTETWKAAPLFADETIDFVWVDADHSEECCTLDIAAWFPKLKPAGWMGGHDYCADGVHNAVCKFFGPRGIYFGPVGQISWQITR
jgi:cephalosporin hydroxylase